MAQNEDVLTREVPGSDAPAASDMGAVLPGSTMRFVVRQVKQPDGTVAYSYLLQPVGAEGAEEADVGSAGGQQAALQGELEGVEGDEWHEESDGVPEQAGAGAGAHPLAPGSRQAQHKADRVRELFQQQQQQQPQQQPGTAPFDARHDAEVFADFLGGKRCFQGGGLSWWQYELCHLRHVVQFHLVPIKCTYN